MTEDQFAIIKRGGGQEKMASAVTLTMAAGVAVTDSTFAPPAGTRVSAIKWHTGTTFTGSPTNINLTLGTAAAGTQYVAAVDVKTAGAPTAATLVAKTDYSNWPSGQAVFATLTAVGGTAPAGTCVVEFEYAPPNPYTG